MSITDKNASKWANWINILDFAGFEDYEVFTGDTRGVGNRYWQFMTNYASESMMQWT